MKQLGLLFVFLVGCGGGDPPTDPVTATTAEPYCEHACEHDVACNGEDLDVCTAECVSGVSGWVREDVLADVADCQAALSCTADSDACLTESCAPTGAHTAYEAECRDALTGCAVPEDQLDEICSVTPVPDTDIGFFCLFAPVIMDDLTACFTDDGTGCATYTECLQGVLDAYGINR